MDYTVVMDKNQSLHSSKALTTIKWIKLKYNAH